MNWRKRRVKITTTTGEPIAGGKVNREYVVGYIARGCPLAVTESLLTKGEWRITHRLSGSAIFATKTVEEAQRIISEILPVGDWNRTAEELARDVGFWRAAHRALTKATKRRPKKEILVVNRSGKIVSVPNPIAGAA